MLGGKDPTDCGTHLAGMKQSYRTELHHAYLLRSTARGLTGSEFEEGLARILGRVRRIASARVTKRAASLAPGS